MVNHLNDKQTTYGPITHALLEQALRLMQEAYKITFLTHRNPDADGISACAALAHVLRQQGKSIEVVYPTAPEAVIKRQAEPVYINHYVQQPDLLIMCDTANYDRLYFPEIFAGIPSINIDHHVSNQLTATVNLVAPDASSTCEFLYQLMKKWHMPIDCYSAEALLMGILYDTQVFRIPSTTAETLRVAADLIDHGADLLMLQDELLRNKNAMIVSLWGKLLSSVQRSGDGKAAWIVVTQELLKAEGVTKAATAGLINFLAQLSDTDVTMLFCEMEDGTTKISLRSHQTDVNTFAKQFGGGGHVLAAGMVLTLPIDEAVDCVTKALLQM